MCHVPPIVMTGLRLRQLRWFLSYSGMVGLATWWVKLAPNGTNPGLFQIRFQCIWRPRAKCTEIWSEKAPDLSRLGANLTHYGALGQAGAEDQPAGVQTAQVSPLPPGPLHLHPAQLATPPLHRAQLMQAPESHGRAQHDRLSLQLILWRHQRFAWAALSTVRQVQAVREEQVQDADAYHAQRFCIPAAKLLPTEGVGGWWDKGEQHPHPLTYPLTHPLTHPLAVVSQSAGWRGLQLECRPTYRDH